MTPSTAKIFLGALIFGTTAVGLRLAGTTKFSSAQTKTSSKIPDSLRLGWDPRGRDQVEEAAKSRESESFRSRLNRSGASFIWPGLKSAQIDWVWLELLQSVHIESAYDRDFSWIFSKIFFVSENAHPKEALFVTELSPFFFVIGKDHVGATVVMAEILRRAPNHYNSWFWSGYHAMDNLSNQRLASDLYGRAALFGEAPPYLASLSYRLLEKSQGRALSHDDRGLLLKQMNPDLLEKLESVRPELFR